MPPAPGAALGAHWEETSAAIAALGAFAGTCWSAFLLWFISRAFLKVRIAYLKAMEIAGLSGMVLALGAVTTMLLIAATGDAAARPALSLLAPHLPAASHLRALLEWANVFYVWATVLLGIGLTKLTGVSFKECAFWVFGYWMVLRLGILVLAW